MEIFARAREIPLSRPIEPFAADAVPLFRQKGGAANSLAANLAV